MQRNFRFSSKQGEEHPVSQLIMKSVQILGQKSDACVLHIVKEVMSAHDLTEQVCQPPSLPTARCNENLVLFCLNSHGMFFFCSVLVSLLIFCKAKV